MTDELEQMSPNQRRALDKALSALETFAAIWAAEIRLGAMSARIAAVPSEAERAKRIAAMIEQGFIEGAYRHYLDHKDKCDELEAARATAGQSEPVPINGADQRDAYEWAIQASCFENSDRSRSARRVFEDILAAVCPDASEAFSLADELDEISERITRFTNSSGDATVTRTAQILREFASITLTGTASTAIAELQNFVAAKRFDRDTFANDTEFADWLLSRARHALKSQQDAAIESQRSGDGS